MARMVKTAGFKKKVERSKKRIASFAKQKIKATKLAKKKVIDKFFPSYKKMSLPQRVKTDQKISARYSGMINKLSVKLMRVVKKKEIEKVAAFKKKVEKSKLRIASPAKQKVKAAKLAKQKVIDKYYPKYKEMGLAQRVKTDQLIQQKYGGMIAKLTMKLMKVVRAKEKEKVKKAREGMQGA